jgi:hypothetical protein
MRMKSGPRITAQIARTAIARAYMRLDAQNIIFTQTGNVSYFYAEENWCCFDNPSAATRHLIAVARTDPRGKPPKLLSDASFRMCSPKEAEALNKAHRNKPLLVMTGQKTSTPDQRASM